MRGNAVSIDQTCVNDEMWSSTLVDGLRNTFLKCLHGNILGSPESLVVVLLVVLVIVDVLE